MLAQGEPAFGIDHEPVGAGLVAGLAAAFFLAGVAGVLDVC